MIDTLSVAWQARDVAAWPASAAAKPGAGAELLFRRTPWYKVVELNVARGSSMKVCRSPVRVKGVQGQK